MSSTPTTELDLEQLRYPVGHFVYPATPPGAAAHAASLEILRKLPEAVENAVRGLNDGQLDTPYRPDGWTVRQLVHHIADSHANAYIRVKLALTEDWPQIKPYDEAAWARLEDSKLPIEISLSWLAAVHRRWLAVFDSLADEQWNRGYLHPENGKRSLRDVLPHYAWHSRHHTAHITNLRARMGW
jgi:uncharacterized damage-inducible protein DinB